MSQTAIIKTEFNVAITVRCNIHNETLEINRHQGKTELSTILAVNPCPACLIAARNSTNEFECKIGPNRKHFFFDNTNCCVYCKKVIENGNATNTLAEK
jgi:hypothetical protein